MGLMLRDRAGIEKASSHSGRKALATNIIHKQEKSIKVAQKIFGHANAATTLIYEEPPGEKNSGCVRESLTFEPLDRESFVAIRLSDLFSWKSLALNARPTKLL